MNYPFWRRSAAAVLTLTILTTQASATDQMFRQAIRYINEYGLIAEKEPITAEQEAEYQAYLAEHPDQRDALLNEILGKMDTHSMYLSGDSYEQNFQTLAGYVGIGITMYPQQDGYRLIQSVIRSGPADNAGVKAGDILLSVDGTDVSTLDDDALVSMVRGKEGSTVNITVQRDGQQLSFTILRSQVNEEYVSAQTLTDGVEYIAIGAIASENDVYDFLDIWDTLDDKNTRSVILDLRGNGGGVVEYALAMLEQFYEDESKLISMHWREDAGGVQNIYTVGGGLPLNKVIVLVDPYTASAAEMMAGSLQDNGVATLIGETTYGKGQGQIHITMPDQRSRLVLTVMEMCLPVTDTCWEGEGLTPDEIYSSQRSLSDYLETVPALDVDAPVVFGQTSDNALALSSRLMTLGYLYEETDTMDSDLLSAVRAYQADNDLPVLLCADEDTLSLLDEQVTDYASRGLVFDEAMTRALAEAIEAAAEPQRYISLADGSWEAAS
jgi:carboxyl-terminal processing protease